jgi:hypothetical protein
MIVCVFGHVQWRFVLNDRLAPGYCDQELGAYAEIVAVEAATARAGNRRKGRVRALRAHTKALYKMNFHRKTLRNAKGA